MRDPVELEVFKNLYHSIAEARLGAALRRTAFSSNIKERRDYLCAVFDSAGQVIRYGRSHAGSLRLQCRCRLQPRSRKAHLNQATS